MGKDSIAQHNRRSNYGGGQGNQIKDEDGSSSSGNMS